ncbi:thiamine phosphate synthase [Vibrio gazogenes]|uniref:Thiamine-phosphate synthase n=1 Tax=Vibrio gazogenes DSM 21264 = NBRC 103151 TaxID=1123492 RepID=A0A1M5BMD5_VIBGA|nr:thiamine phosphate synthase [Vibrio gazogenes]USP13740.1 thiamine phosphate synthase [Vibrio gazogenes]SHF43668.1 thiamine-phosphate diphosphorylase [Vibrio gazogenes DSM 21264] [Vibrio gazogenes DSM 21264 = NBRC 103151]SJN56528.1 Thiamine-phosphate synthase [Vibrio gazogenes]
MIGLRISKALLTAEMSVLLKEELHHFLTVAQTEGLAAADTSLFFDENNVDENSDDGWFICLGSIDLRKPDKYHGVVVGKQSVMLTAEELPQQNIQQHYHVTYCEQIKDQLLTDGRNDQPRVWKTKPLSKINPEDGGVVNLAANHVMIASSPQPDAPLSERWLVGDEVCSLSPVAQADASNLISILQYTFSQHSFVSKHLAWFIGGLILDFPLEDALIIARASLNVSRETWPRSAHDFPVIAAVTDENLDIDGDIENTSGEKSSTVVELPISETAISDTNDNWHYFNAVNAADLSLYPVVDDVIWVEKLLRLGVKTIQLRIKNPHQTDLEQQIKQAVLLGKTYQAQVFINDYWQLAIQYQAFGVHLGQGDLPTADIQALRHAGIRLGISTHGYWEILKAQQLRPSYIALGHIFPTTTKQMPSQPQGLARLRLYQQLVDSIAEAHHRAIPTVAIGGIDLENAATVLAQGVSSLAVVRAVTQAANTVSVVDAFQRLFLSPEGGLLRRAPFQSGRRDNGITR